MYGEQEQLIFDNYLLTNELIPKMIINTHAHIDHILSVQALKIKYGIPFGLHKAELPVLNNAAGSALLFGLELKGVPAVDFFIEEGKPFPMGEAMLEVRLAPGHSPGSIIFYSPENKFVISGDVLFQGSIGRSDLPGGNAETLMNSIREQLYTLPDQTMVYPGHGAITQIGQEKLTNPFVRA
jgi:glyoxylase-like metal-dependent hydrolase (beta-lactamase superfamily II)